MSQPGGASLDGEPPASACAATSTRYPKAARGRARSLGSGRSRVRWSAVLAEPRSTAPPRFTSRRRRSRPLAGLATRPLTSPVTTLGGSASLPIPFRFGPPGPASPAVSSRTEGSTAPGRLPSTSAPSPEHARRLRALRVGSRGARHRCRCSRARGFRHRDPASGAPSPAELGPRTRREHESQRARPRICRSGTRRRSSTSATNSTREHDRGTARSPPRVRKNEAHVRLRAPLTPLSGVGSATKRAETLSLLCRRGARRAVRPKPRRPTKSPHRARAAPSLSVVFGARPKAIGNDGCQPRFHGPGADSLRCRRLPRSICLSADRRRGRYPNPIRSDTSCRETVAPPTGEAGDCQAGLTGSLPATISPREPLPPRRVEAHGPPDGPACAKPPAMVLRRSPCDERGGPPLTCVACADTRGARAASPALPRRRPRSAAPEVPSIDEPATPPCAAEAVPGGDPNRTNPFGDRGFSTGCCQPVGNTRRLFATSLDPQPLTG